MKALAIIVVLSCALTAGGYAMRYAMAAGIGFMMQGESIEGPVLKYVLLSAGLVALAVALAVLAGRMIGWPA